MFGSAALPVRASLAEAAAQAWGRLAAPGPALTATERIAIAREARAATHCSLCRERTAALSPSHVPGHHTATAALPAVLVDAAHRIATDPSRLTRAWYQHVARQCSAAAYVETVGVLATVTFVDTLALALGAGLPPLPSAGAGEATGQVPSHAEVRGAWVPTVPTTYWTGDLRAVFPYDEPPRVANILLAMSLVPAEALGLITLMVATLQFPQLTLSPAQKELLASTVSALNRCYYCTSYHTVKLSTLAPQVDLASLLHDEDEGTLSVPQGPALRRLARAAHDGTADLGAARDAVLAEMGEAATVDAASVIAFFEAINRVASATGTELDEEMQASAVLDLAWMRPA